MSMATMQSVQSEEGSFTTPDGQKLFTKTWKPSGPVVAYLVFIHGFSDHCSRYGDLFPTFAGKGIEVRSFDQRGWGRSVTKKSERGLSGPTTTVMADMEAFITMTLAERPNKAAPVFLMGHSMGGQEVAYFASTAGKETLRHIRGYVLEAPFIAFYPASKPSWLKEIAGRVAGRLLPRFQLLNALDVTFISRDKKVQEEYLEDPLCHDTTTLEGAAGLLDRTAALGSGKVTIPPDAGEGGKVRIWIGHGTGDKICEYGATKEFFERLDPAIEDKEFRTFDGWYHELHMDLPADRATFANEVLSWILARVDADRPPSSKL